LLPPFQFGIHGEREKLSPWILLVPFICNLYLEAHEVCSEDFVPAAEAVKSPEVWPLALDPADSATAAVVRVALEVSPEVSSAPVPSYRRK